MSATSLRPTVLTAAAMFVSMLLATDCQHPQPGRVRVLQVVPGSGEVSSLRSGIRVVFDRPVVPASAAGGPLARPGIVLDPPVAGESRWLDRQTLGFFPSAPLRPSTAYTVRLAPDVAPVGRWEGMRFV